LDKSVSILYVILCVLWTAHQQLEPSKSKLLYKQFIDIKSDNLTNIFV